MQDYLSGFAGQSMDIIPDIVGYFRRLIQGQFGGRPDPELVVRTLGTFLQQHARSWCASPELGSSPFGIEVGSFDSDAGLLVSAKWDAWISWDIKANNGCGAGGAVLYDIDGTLTHFDLHPPHGPCVENAAFTPVPNLRKAWDDWSSAWNSFESLQGSSLWVVPKLIYAASQDGSGPNNTQKPSLLPQFALKADGTVVLSVRDKVVFSRTFPDMKPCSTSPDDGNSGCASGIDAVYVAPGAIMVRYLDESSYPRDRLISIKDVMGDPFLFCSQNAANIFFSDSLLRALSIQASLIDAKIPNLRVLPNPQLPPKPSEDGWVANGLDDALSRNDFEFLRDFLARIERHYARRFQMLPEWISYLDLPRLFREEDERAKKEAIEADRRQRDQARHNKQTLAAVPTNGRKCKMALDRFRRLSAEIERDAVSGNPSAVESKNKQRKIAADAACEAARSLREAIQIYVGQGLQGAARAIIAEYSDCISACQ